MVSKQIIVFKCVVNVCDQDFGAFCRERAPEEKKRFGEQPGATKLAPGWALGDLVEVDCGFGGVAWAPWVLGAMLVVGGWFWALRSLLGWLWWHWVFWLWRTIDRSTWLLSPASSVRRYQWGSLATVFNLHD